MLPLTATETYFVLISFTEDEIVLKRGNKLELDVTIEEDELISIELDRDEKISQTFICERKDEGSTYFIFSTNKSI